MTLAIVLGLILADYVRIIHNERIWRQALEEVRATQELTFRLWREEEEALRDQ